MKFKSTFFTLIVLATTVTLSQSQNLNELSNDICAQNQCKNLLSAEIFKGMNEIKNQQEECYRNCKVLDQQCVQQCISTLYNHAELKRIKTCYENQQSMQTLKKLMFGVGINSECTASLRYNCRPYVDVKI